MVGCTHEPLGIMIDTLTTTSKFTEYPHNEWHARESIKVKMSSFQILGSKVWIIQNENNIRNIKRNLISFWEVLGNFPLWTLYIAIKNFKAEYIFSTVWYVQFNNNVRICQLIGPNSIAQIKCITQIKGNQNISNQKAALNIWNRLSANIIGGLMWMQLQIYIIIQFS